ncbi:MAG: F0F1 ATP synthase subunit B [Actinobacteria bacterium]|nr:F0F1 ATP synthase subunit B [Actinomycetota bacterium]
MLSIQPGLMIYTLITFGILLFVLKKYAFGPLQAVIDQRRDAIEESIHHAEEMDRKAKEALAEYRQSISTAKMEAEQIVERARKIGDDQKAEIIGEAHVHAQKEVENARDQIRRETRKAVDEIKDQVADLTILAAGKVAGRTITKEDHLRLVDEALAEVDFDRLGAGGN